MFAAKTFTVAGISRMSVCMDLVFQHVMRNPKGVAANFTEDAVMTVVCEKTGAVLERGHGRAGVEGVFRRFHENVEMSRLRVDEADWTEAGFTLDWRCAMRGWGWGPTQVTEGSVGAIFEGAYVREMTLLCDSELYRLLLRPDTVCTR